MIQNSKAKKKHRHCINKKQEQGSTHNSTQDSYTGAANSPSQGSTPPPLTHTRRGERVKHRPGHEPPTATTYCRHYPPPITSHPSPTTRYQPPLPRPPPTTHHPTPTIITQLARLHPPPTTDYPPPTACRPPLRTQTNLSGLHPPPTAHSRPPEKQHFKQGC